MKKLLSIILFICIALFANAYDFVIDGIAYKLNSNGISVMVTNGINYIGDIEIPSSVTYNGNTYSVTSIGNGAFSGCSGLTSITIGNSVTSIGNGAFYGCSGLTSVSIGNLVTSISSTAFQSCSSLTSVIWNAKECNDFSDISYPFKNLTNIKSFTFGNEVEKIPAYLCNRLSGLISITIPNSVTSIGTNAFYNCSGLTSVNISDLAAWCNIDFNSNPLYYAHNLYINGSKVTDLVIPNTVTTIKGAAFSGCTGLTSVAIPNSVTSIGNGAFNGCIGLTSITIPNSVTSIGERSFQGCTGLTSVIWNAKTCNDCSYDSPFKNLSNIKSFTFGNEVEKIPANLCSQLSGLTSVSIGNSVTSIGNGAFSGCSGLTSVTIGNSVTEISAYCFDSCTGLTSVTIPNSVTTIGNGAFYSCSGLTLVTWNVKIGNDFTSSGYSPFNDCTNIQFFSFGNEVEKIPAFLCYGLIGLTSVTIPNSVILIGNGAFEGCSGLNTAIIGENVTSIGEKAFKNCSLMENIVALRERPIFINSNVFEGVPKASCDLHVRQGSKIRYENQDVWKDFLIIVEDAEDWADVGGGSTTTLKGDVNGDGHVNSADVTAIYDILLGNE